MNESDEVDFNEFITDPVEYVKHHNINLGFVIECKVLQKKKWHYVKDYIGADSQKNVIKKEDLQSLMTKILHSEATTEYDFCTNVPFILELRNQALSRNRLEHGFLLAETKPQSRLPLYPYLAVKAVDVVVPKKVALHHSKAIGWSKNKIKKYIKSDTCHIYCLYVLPFPRCVHTPKRSAVQNLRNCTIIVKSTPLPESADGTILAIQEMMRDLERWPTMMEAKEKGLRFCNRLWKRYVHKAGITMENGAYLKYYLTKKMTNRGRNLKKGVATDSIKKGRKKGREKIESRR